MGVATMIAPGLTANAATVLITAPTADVISVDDCKSLLGISGDDQDDAIEAAIGAISATLDPASGGWLGRALRPQTWELRLSAFPSGMILLPYPVLTELTSIKYDDSNGTEQTLTVTTDYRVFGQDGHNRAYVTPAYNGSWPVARYDDQSVRIRYVCGYDGTSMPKPILSAIALGVRNLIATGERNLYLAEEDVPGVRTRRWVVSETAERVLRTAFENLLSNYRVY